MGGPGEDLPEAGPQTQGPISDREERSHEAALPEAPQHAGTGLGGLTVAELRREQLLAAIVTGADDHEQAAVLLFQAGTDTPSHQR
jgi:hypothetical protein